MNIYKNIFAPALIIISLLLSLPANAATDFLKFPDLKVGQTSSFVKEVQKVLNNNGFNITNVGVGSLGQESTYFGGLTKKALVNFQNQNNITPATGNFGTKTKTKIDEFLKSGKFKGISSGTPVAYGSDTCPSVSQYGITWTFATPVVCGQFINGDWWVVSPVTITNITPLPVNTGSSINGSMINPIPKPPSYSGFKPFGDNPPQGLYSSGDTASTYRASENVAYNLPKTITASSSLVSTINNPDTWKCAIDGFGNIILKDTAHPEWGCQLHADAEKTWFKEIAILTVLTSVPAQGSFRPPYAGTDKTIKDNWNISTFNSQNAGYSKLRSLQVPILSNRPGWTELEEALKRPVLEMASDYINSNWKASWLPYKSGGYYRKTYGREIASLSGTAGVMLNTNASNAQKEKSLIYMTQWGIDTYGLVKSGMIIENKGGHGSGRMLPIFFAAKVLGDSQMMTAVSNGYFSENMGHFFVTDYAVQNAAKTPHNPPYKPYTQAQADARMPEWTSDAGGENAGNAWGEKSAAFCEGGANSNPALSCIEGGTLWYGIPYRSNSGASNMGQVTTVLLMNGRSDLISTSGGTSSTWDAFLRYHTERFYPVKRSGIQEGAAINGTNGITAFIRDMYDAHILNGAIPDNPQPEPDPGTPTTPTHPAPDSFVCGDTIKTYKSATYVNNTESISTPITAGAGQANPHPINTTATVISGPNLVGGIYWYKVSYQDGLVGYSGGDNFDLVSHNPCSGNNNPVTLTPPTITSPAAGALPSNTGSVTLSWDAVPGANAYYVRMKEFTDSSRTIETGPSRRYSLNTNPQSPFYLYVDGNTSRTITGVDVDPNRYYEFWVNAYNTSAPNTFSQTVSYFFNVPASGVTTYTLAASKSGNGTGYINGISAATTTLDSGTSITLTASSTAGSSFSGWSGDCSGNNLSCTLSMNGNKSVNAAFALNTSTPTDEDLDGIMDSNDRCLDTPASLRTLVNNHGCPRPIVTNLRINNDVTTSDLTNISNLEIEGKNGSFGKIRYNQPVNIFGTTDKRSQIDLDSYITIASKRVEVKSGLAPQFNAPATITLYGINLTKPLIKKGDEVYATSSSPLMTYNRASSTLTFTVTGFSTYDVIEGAPTYTLTASKNGSGSGSIFGIDNGTTLFVEGTSLTLTASANIGSTFAGWTGSCVGTGACLVTMNDDKSVTATFNADIIPPGTGGGGGGGGGGGTTPGAYVNPNNTGLGATTTYMNPNGTITTTTTGYVFVKDLKVNARDNEVIKLQQFLNARGYTVATKGAGSPGLESTYFGPATQVALAKFQRDNKIVPASGFFGSLTKAFINKMGGTTTTTTAAAPAVNANTTGKFTFTKNLTVNSRDPEVIQLQKFLNGKGYVIASKGAGSPGLESTYFGPATRTALARWQRDNGITPASGYFGNLTRAALNK